MFENLSLQAKRIIELAKEISEELNIPYVGSESLLLAMFETENTVCQFILSEYDITSEEIREIINKCVFLRKHDVVEDVYTKKFSEIVLNSENIRIESDSKFVYDEHLFYGLLITENSVALKILELLGLVIEDLFKEFNNLFEFTDIKNDKFINTGHEESFLVNLTQLAKNNKLNPFVGRRKYLDRIIKILSKKQKNNPLLIGSAGVGKTAIVEGLAQYYEKANPEITLYYLDLASLMAGTKYRGDLEQRVINTLKALNKNNNILFIDEVHNILGAGSSEGSLDIANILKPLLSRSEIKCIGATTLDEYYKFIDKDKALSRRFQNVYVEEPSHEETLEILKGIKKSYEDFHGVIYSDDILEYIIESSQIIHNRKMPDKVIDILDESGYMGKLKEEKTITEYIIDEVVFDLLGIDYSNSLDKIKNNIHFPKLKKYYLRYLFNINPSKTIANIQINNDDLLDLLIEDITNVFNVKNEARYKIDLMEYQDHHTLSSLLGAPPGYIGFDSGGQLTDHVIKYPISVVIIKNYHSGHEKIKSVIENILKDGQIIDFKGREINFKSTIFIFCKSNSNAFSIGFNKTKINSEKIIPSIDEILDLEHTKNTPETNIMANRYINKLRSLGYTLNLDFDISDLNSMNELLEVICEIHDESPANEINMRMETTNNKILINK